MQKIKINDRTFTSKEIISLCKDTIKILKTDHFKDLSFVGFHVALTDFKREVDFYPAVPNKTQEMIDHEKIINKRRK